MVLGALTSLFRTNSPGHYSPLPLDETKSRDSSEDFSTLETGRCDSLASSPSVRRSSVTPIWRPDPRIISDATLGLSDGLTVPFALTAGLAALGDTKLVVFAGLAELMAGAISMGVGGYLGASGEA